MKEKLHWSRHALLSGLLGVFAGALTIALIEWLGHWLLGSAAAPQPAQAASPMLLIVVLAWLAGAAVAAWVAGRWHASGRRTAGMGAALVLWSGTAFTLWAVPHPWWAVGAALLLMPATGWLAATHAARAGA